MKLDVGSGDRGKSGYMHLDKHDFSEAYPEGDFVQHDIKEPLPFLDGSVEGIWCHHVLEHLPHRHPSEDIDYLVWVMNEFHRVLKIGGEAHIIVPWCKHPNNWRCPTHYRFFNEYSFQWWTYRARDMPGEMEASGRQGCWGCIKNCIHDNTHIYAILQKLENYP